MADNIPVIVPISTTSMATEEMLDNTNPSSTTNVATPSAGSRLLDGLPQTEYQIERVKIGVGSYDKDGGDATYANPFPVGTSQERQLLETHFVAAINASRIYLQIRARERIPLIDRRGSIGQRGRF